MKITCLIENTSSCEGIAAEHGLSLFIETEKEKILFDMGQTEAFSLNASRLGVSLPDADFAVLSHGHYDHGGGLEAFLAINKKAPVYMNGLAFEPHYNGKEKYIGLDKRLEDNERLIFTDDYYEIRNGISLHSCNGKELINEIDSGGLYKLNDDEFIPDDFRHEQYLLLEENGKRILISGCSHKGIINICDWFSPDILIGGFHFSKYPLDEKLLSLAEKLNSYATVFYTCHCTGVEQYEFMKNSMKNLNYISAGETIFL